jgi:hypothetical protein
VAGAGDGVSGRRWRERGRRGRQGWCRRRTRLLCPVAERGHRGGGEARQAALQLQRGVRLDGLAGRLFGPDGPSN